MVPLVDPVIYKSIQPEFLMKLQPETTAQQQDKVSLYYVLQGIPSSYVTWLHNQSMVEEPRLYSLKHDGPLCCLNVMNVGPKQGETYTYKIISASEDSECSTQLRVKTGWHFACFASSYSL